MLTGGIGGWLIHVIVLVLNLGKRRSGWSASRPTSFNPHEKVPEYPLNKRFDGHRSQHGLNEKEVNMMCLLKIASRIRGLLVPHPLHCTDLVSRLPKCMCKIKSKLETFRIIRPLFLPYVFISSIISVILLSMFLR
jgi:hypothetical protein